MSFPVGGTTQEPSILQHTRRGQWTINLRKYNIRQLSNDKVKLLGLSFMNFKMKLLFMFYIFSSLSRKDALIPTCSKGVF